MIVYPFIIRVPFFLLFGFYKGAYPGTYDSKGAAIGRGVVPSDQFNLLPVAKSGRDFVKPCDS